MKNTTLGISWLNGRLTAQVFGRGREVASWEGSGEVVRLEEMTEGIREAISQTGFEGRDVLFVVATPRLSSQRVEAPPVRGATFERLLKRKVQHISPFKEDAVWGYVESTIRNQSRGAIVQMLPASVFDAILAACETHGLRLTRLFTPIDGLVEKLLERVGTQKKAALLAVETGGMVNLVAGSADGKVVFARTFQSAIRADREVAGPSSGKDTRVAQELQRSVSYCETQLDQRIDEVVWLGSAEEATAIGGRMGQAVDSWPIERPATAWIEETSTIPVVATQNLVPAEVRARRKSETLIRWTGVAVILFFIGSLACLFSAETSLKRERALEAEATNRRIDTLRRQAEVQGEIDGFNARSTVMETVVTQDRELLWHWVPAYLNAVVPEDWALTSVTTEPVEGGLLLAMEGYSNKASRIPSTILSVFREGLHDDVFDVRETLVGEASIQARTLRGDIRKVTGFRARVEVKGINTDLKITQN